MSLQDKVALVVGGSQGVGRAYALALAREGAKVVVAALGEPAEEREALAEVIRAAAGEGREVLALPCDVVEEAQVRRVVDEVITKYDRIDVLVNVAGIYPKLDTFTMNLADWDRVMNVNVRGSYLTMRTVAPHMISRRSGSIINLTSLTAKPAAKDSIAHDRLAVYGTSKAALERLTLFFAEELREYGIAVNAISPGVVPTESVRRTDPRSYEIGLQSGNPPTPEVLGPPIVYLAAQTASTLTGQILHTNNFRKSWP